MLEIFDLSAEPSGVADLWNDPGVGVWALGTGPPSEAAGARTASVGAGDLPPAWSRLESCLFLRAGRLQLDAATILEGPALALVPPGDLSTLEALDSPVQAFLWVLYAAPGEAMPAKRRVLLGPADLGTPRTITASTSILHWLPRSTNAERRTLAGNPSLALNLGDAPIPMVMDGELVPLAGIHGAVAHDVVTLRVVPGSGPVVAVERIVPT